MSAYDPADDLEELARQLGRLGDVLGLPEESLLREMPDISSWSTGAHVFHMVLACDLSLRNAVSLAKDAGRLVREPEDRKDEGQEVLTAGRIPRGVAKAPRFVTPPSRIDLDLTRQMLAEVGEARTGIAADLDALRAAPRAIPHQALGDLTGPEWVRFARVHTNHHLEIVDELLAALA